jgi:hypothetical protein
VLLDIGQLLLVVQRGRGQMHPSVNIRKYCGQTTEILIVTVFSLLAFYSVDTSILL